MRRYVLAVLVVVLVGLAVPSCGRKAARGVKHGARDLRNSVKTQLTGEKHVSTGPLFGRREYGTTTGRPRRCGWLDLVLLKYAIFINGVSELAITKIDVLDEFETVKVCVGYKYKGDVISDVDLDDKILLQCEPVYKDMPGWKRSLGDVSDKKDLPKELMALIAFVEDEARVPVSIASVGPDRDQTVMLA